MSAALFGKIATLSELMKGKVSGFFEDGHERTVRVKKNVAASLALKGVTVAISLLLVPMTINYIDPTQYGIWLTLSSMIAWLNFLDIGLANGLKNKIAGANANGWTADIRAYVSTTYAILAAVAIGIFVLFALGGYFLDWSRMLNAHAVGSANLNLIVLIVVGAFCVQFLLQPLSSMLAAFHSVAVVSLIYAIGQFGCLVGVFLLTHFASSSLLNLVVVLTCVPLFVQGVATVWCFKYRYARYAPTYSAIDLTHAKSLLSTGGMFFFVQIGSLLLFQTDNIVIAQLFDPQHVTVFSIAYKLFSIVSMIFTIAMTPVWPAFTDAYEKNDVTWIKDVFKKMYRYFCLLSVCAVFLLFLSPELFELWLGGSVRVPFALSLVMVAYVIGICWMTIHCYFVNGTGKIKLQLYLYIISTIVNIPLAILFGTHLGLLGVTLSNLLIVIVMGVVLYLQCRKIVGNTALGIWNA